VSPRLTSLIRGANMPVAEALADAIECASR